MKTKIKNINDFTKELTCIVPWEELEDLFKEEFNKVKSNHTPKGGRKGKVFGRDLELFKKNYSTAIEATFAEKSLNQFYHKALQEENLNPIDQAKVSKLDFSEGKELTFTLTFEVIPDIKLPNYEKKFKVKMVKYVQADDDVNHALEELRQQHSNLKTIDDGAKSGNFINADFQELDESDIPIIGKKLDKQYIKLGVGAFSGSSEKDLLGVKPEDKRKVTINYGEGKTSRYEISINKVEEQILPDLDDGFASTVSPDLKTLDDLKAQIKDNIQKSIDDDYEKRKRESFITHFVQKTKFKAPESMVNRYVEKFIEEEQKKNKDLDVDKLKEDSKEMADFNVKWYIIKDRLITKSKVSVNNDDIDNEIKKVIDESNEEQGKIEEFFSNPSNRESLSSNLLNEKLFTYINEYAIISNSEKSTEELRKQK